MPSGRPIPSGPRADRRRKRILVCGSAQRTRQAWSGARSAPLIGESHALAPKRRPTVLRPRRHFFAARVPSFAQNL